MNLLAGDPDQHFPAMVRDDRLTMSVSEWSRVPDNPVQRDTEFHAKRAKHLHQPSPMHRFVTMAELPDGSRFKVDGHTRSYLWDRNEIARPQTVLVDIIDCPDIETVELLYEHFDNQGAAETAAEQLSGAVRREGLEFQSAMMRRYRFGSGLKRAYLLSHPVRPNTSWRELPFTFDAVSAFADELIWLDSLSPLPTWFPRGIITAFLITMRRAGEDGIAFWRAYAGDQGEKSKGRMDAVQALYEEVLGANRPAKGTMASLSQPWQDALYAKALTAFEGYREGRTYSKGLRRMNAPMVRAYARGPKGDLPAPATMRKQRSRYVT